MKMCEGVGVLTLFGGSTMTSMSSKVTSESEFALGKFRCNLRHLEGK